MRWIALLRGVNVGGSKKVPMARLRELLSDLGHDDVRTYVQSGNVVFGAGEASAERIAGEIERAIEGEFGFGVRITMRTHEELAAVVAANPFPDAVAEPKTLHVLFLAAAVAADRLDDVHRAAFEPELFELRERELYLWLPDGIGRSALAARLTERRLGVEATARNWRTVRTLLELADSVGAVR